MYRDIQPCTYLHARPLNIGGSLYSSMGCYFPIPTVATSRRESGIVLCSRHVLLSEWCLTGVSVKRVVFQRFSPHRITYIKVAYYYPYLADIHKIKRSTRIPQTSKENCAGDPVCRSTPLDANECLLSFRSDS